MLCKALVSTGAFLFCGMRKPGDIFIVEATGYFAPGIECIVMEVNDTGGITKAKAAVPDPLLAKVGFIQEGDDYVFFEWRWSPN